MESQHSSSGSDNSSDSEKSLLGPVKFSFHLPSKTYIKRKSNEESQENVQHITEFDYSPRPLKTIPRLTNSWRLSMLTDSHVNGKAHCFDLPTQILQDNSVISEKGSEEGLSKEEIEKRNLREDIKLCADEASLEAYETMPVEEFGEALLRGMGWSRGKAIGLNSTDPVIPYQYPNTRVGRLGLGASLPLHDNT